MVKVKDSPYLAPDGTILVESWLQQAAALRPARDMQIIRNACVLSKLAGEEHPAPTNVSCLQQGLTMAEILLDLHLDADTIAAALVYNSVRYAGLNSEDVREHLGEQVEKLVRGTIQMDAIHSLPGLDLENHSQLENVRKMLLAMVEDMRVVIIKLAERTAIMRNLDFFDPKTQKQYAKETKEIYAPLANRLGIGQLKWELEDRSFRYLDSDDYHQIAKLLHENRIAREKYIEKIIATLKEILTAAHLKDFDVQGRVKHIYSIHRKMTRKKISFNELHDLNAVRVLVNTVEECYTVLSSVHSLWPHVPSEFDDYIATPKSNGYRSIHTALNGPENKIIEIQIRTFQMHKDSEHGVAAHWRYKEGGDQKAGYEAKIAWLRQVLEWQKELNRKGVTSQPENTTILDDRVYVFTPTGEIIDLQKGSTPLDFAYLIHSEVGHRCRGAKVNNHMVPLTYILNTGEQVEIVRGKHPNPSRDWLNPHLGYLKSTRAKAKVHHWFRLQDYDRNCAEGQNIVERECQRLALSHVDHDKIAHRLHYKNAKDMFAALGNGDLRISQIIGAIQIQQEVTKKASADIHIPLHAPSKTTGAGISIAGVGNLLTHTAQCCKPVPGDAIIGFITRGKGVAIHLRDCHNVLNLSEDHQNKLFEVDWGHTQFESYPAEIIVEAYDRSGLVRDITTLVANERMNLLALTTATNKTENIATIHLTLETPGLNELSKLLDRIKHIPNVFEVKRIAGHA